MKKTLLYLKMTFLVINGLLASSCGGNSYRLDYSGMSFPEIKQDRDVKEDLALYEEIRMYSNISSGGEVHVLTDKKAYHPGEEIILTVDNQSLQTEYFYPSDEDAKFSLKITAKKEVYLDHLVSKDPGMIGDFNYHDPRLIFLYLEGTNSISSNKYGVNGFDDPLEPGEKMIFKIKLPKRAGRYLLALRRYPHDPDKFAFGANAFDYSNIFEITDH